MSYLVNIYGLGGIFFAPRSETFKLFRRYRGISQTLRVHCADNNTYARIVHVIKLRVNNDFINYYY